MLPVSTCSQQTSLAGGLRQATLLVPEMRVKLVPCDDAALLDSIGVSVHTHLRIFGVEHCYNSSAPPKCAHVYVSAAGHRGLDDENAAI